ncbi:MAG: phage baseplate assembly protein V, partial [Ginsengibacter sp.]
YTSINLIQKFNAHHEFTIRLNHDILEQSGSFSLENAQKKIGKSVLIRLQQLHFSSDVAYEFRGIICEIKMEQSGNSNSDIVLVGYSPTILLENGQDLSSFYENDLKKIVEKLTKPLNQVNCNVSIKPQYTKQIKYICQYKESSFHFINRLSSEFSEFFYYDGKDLNFGKPTSIKEIEVVYGEDISSMQLTLRAKPMKFTNYGYLSKTDKIESYDAPTNVNGMGQYASYILKESDNLFSEPVNMPVKQRIENKSDLENFVKKQKASMAANLEVLTGTSYNPLICIGSVINVKVSKLQELSHIREDYGKFLVIGIEHHVNENGKYYNSFEAVPSEVEVLPVANVVMPLAEPQIAAVKDNKDPDGAGRVRVQMLWQTGNDMTDWIRVMTPDAGGGKDGARNRGFVAIPEKGDQVLVCFRYNDPDRPFVMGSLFHGKNGGGGGSGNSVKSLTALSGGYIQINGNELWMVDPEGNFVHLDGAGNIMIKASAEISLVVGDSYIVIRPSEIGIKSAAIDIHGTTEASMRKDHNTKFKVSGSSALMKADTATMFAKTAKVKGVTTAKVSGAKVTVEATGKAEVKGGIVEING